MGDRKEAPSTRGHNSGNLPSPKLGTRAGEDFSSPLSINPNRCPSATRLHQGVSSPSPPPPHHGRHEDFRATAHDLPWCQVPECVVVRGGVRRRWGLGGGGVLIAASLLFPHDVHMKVQVLVEFQRIVANENHIGAAGLHRP